MRLIDDHGEINFLDDTLKLSEGRLCNTLSAR
jgi:hypothetical protein